MDYKKFEEYQVMMDQADPADAAFSVKVAEKLIELEASEMCVKAALLHFITQTSMLDPYYQVAFMVPSALATMAWEKEVQGNFNNLDEDLAYLLLGTFLVEGEDIREKGVILQDNEVIYNLKQLIPYFDGSKEFVEIDRSWK
jgi:hypothetical protein